VKQLLAFRGLAHDPQGILTAIYQFALVHTKLERNVGVSIRQAGLKLSIAPFTYASSRRALLHNPQFALCHEDSLAPNACANETAPVPTIWDDLLTSQNILLKQTNRIHK
jgi:hypothetical protein